MKKKLIAIALAVATTLSVPMSVSAVWQKDTAGNWQWSESGHLQTGWKQIGGKWYHFNQNGIMNTGWLNDNGTWYYLDNSGAMKIGWLLHKGTWYYLNPNGAMATGWKNINGQWYYLQNWGGMLTGWLNDNGNTYYLDSWGSMATNWRMVDGSWYYMNASGIREIGWIEINGKRYFLDENGAMQTGIIEVNGEVYYLDVSGAAATGKVKIDGKTYEFAETGESIGIRTPKPEKAFDESGKKMEVTVDGGISGGGSIGGGGSSSGGSSGGSGGSGGDSDGEVEPPEYKIRFDVDDGTWKDTEEGIQFTAKEGNYFCNYLEIGASGDSLFYYRGHDNVILHGFNIDDLFVEPEKMTGKLSYWLKNDEIGSSTVKTATLTQAELIDEILTLTYTDFDETFVMRLKIADNKKSIVWLDVSSSSLAGPNGEYKFIRVCIDSLSDTSALVKTEEEIRDALANENINEIISVKGTQIEFKNPLTITRDVYIRESETGTGYTSWYPSTDSWQGGNQALISIQNGANVRFSNMWLQSFERSSTCNTLIEVKNASIEVENTRFACDRYDETRCLYLENAEARLSNMEVIWPSPIGIGIEMDTIEGSKSSLEFISGDIRANKQIISGSPDSTVILPNGFVEFSNDDGQREWTNDPDKFPPDSELK